MTWWDRILIIKAIRIPNNKGRLHRFEIKRLLGKDNEMLFERNVVNHNFACTPNKEISNLKYKK